MLIIRSFLPVTRPCSWVTPNRMGGYPTSIQFGAGIHVSSIYERARRGTRARKAKGKVKIEQKIRPFLLKLQEQKNKTLTDTRPVDKSHLPESVDDVYFHGKYKPKEWNFLEALQNHREIHHPTVYNRPNSPLILRIDMDFRYPNRPQKCMDGWKSLVEMKAPFLLQGMTVPTILAILPNDEGEIARTLAAGADVAGNVELVKEIQQGQLRPADYEFIVCHPLVLPEITPIRGLLKKNFPNVKTGTISVDIPEAVKRIRACLKFRVTTSNAEPDYAYIDTPIGTLNMDAVGLEQNFESILTDTLGRRVSGKTADEFIIQCLLKTPNTFEVFKLNIAEVIKKCDKIKGQKPKVTVDQGTEDESTEEATESNERVAANAG